MHLNPYSAASLLSGLICAGLSLFAWRQRPFFKVAAFAGSLLAMALYAGGYGFELASSDLPTILFWIRIEYLGTAPLPALWLILTLQTIGWERFLTRRVLMLIFVIPILVLALNYTNDLHHWFYQTVALDRDGPFPRLAFTRGPGYWIHAANVYLSFLAGCLLLIRKIPHLPAPSRNQAISLLAATFIPLFVYTAYIFGWHPLPDIDPTPFAFVLTGAIMSWSLYRYGLLDLIPIARETVVENLRAGVLTLDVQGQIVYFNRMLQKMLQLPAGAMAMPLWKALEQAEHSHLAQALSAVLFQEEELDVEIATGEAWPAYVSVRSAALNGQGGKRVGQVFTLSDISRRMEAEIGLHALANDLENRVAERTAELEKTIQRLEGEIVARKQAETDLRAMKDHLTNRVAEGSRKLSALYDVILAGGNYLELADLLNESFQKILTALNASAGCVFREKGEEGEFWIHAQAGLNPAAVERLEGIAIDSIAREDYGIYVDDFQGRTDIPEELCLPEMRALQAAPVRMRGRKVGILVVWWSEAQAFSVDDIAMFGALADQLGILMENVALRQRIGAEAVLQERRRLARDLHDSVTQSLHSLIMHTDTAIHRLQAGKLDRLENSLVSVRESARQSLKEMRLLLYEMRLKPLQETRILEALKIRLDAVEARAGIEASLQVGEPGAWPREWESEMYPIAMEALNNSLKHAHATQVNIALNGSRNWFEMEISDNGCGFEPGQNSNGMGLTNMQERAERLGGTLKIASSLGQGTRVQLYIGTQTEAGTEAQG